MTGLPSQSRYITDHDENGQSIFSSFSDKAVYESINPDMDFFIAYINNFPPDMNNFADLSNYKKVLEGPQPSITVPGGTVLRVCNFAPGSTTAMHRTLSLDYGIVVEGEVELVLDSGETRLLKVGDIAVQRGTMHAWRVPGRDKWSRMIFILQDSKPLQIGGKVLRDEYGGIDVQSSDEYTRRSNQ